MKRFPHGADALADAEIADAQLPQVHVHVGEHRIEHRLREFRPGRGVVAKPVDQQEGMQADKIEPAIERVGHAESGVEVGCRAAFTAAPYSMKPDRSCRDRLGTPPTSSPKGDRPRRN